MTLARVSVFCEGKVTERQRDGERERFRERAFVGHTCRQNMNPQACRMQRPERERERERERDRERDQTERDQTERQCWLGDGYIWLGNI